MANYSTQAAAQTERARSLVHHLSVCLIHGSKLRKPKFLECGHTFCQGCLEKHAKTQSCLDETGQVVHPIPCPVCRQLTTLSGRISSLPSNRYCDTFLELQTVIPQLELQNDIHETDATANGRVDDSIRCTLCKRTTSSDAICFVCFECPDYFCTKCFSVQHEPNFPEHTQWVRLNEGVGELVQHQCQKHHQLYTWFCKTCKRALCKTCRLEGLHQGHTIIHSLDEHGIKESALQVNTLKQSLEEGKRSAERKTERLQREYDRVRVHYADLEIQLKKRRDELKKSIDRLYDVMEQKRIEYRRTDEKLLQAFQEELNFYTSCADSLSELVSRVEMMEIRGVHVPIYLYSDLYLRMETIINDLSPRFVSQPEMATLAWPNETVFGEWSTAKSPSENNDTPSAIAEAESMSSSRCNSGEWSLKGRQPLEKDQDLRDSILRNPRKKKHQLSARRRSVEAHSPVRANVMGQESSNEVQYSTEKVTDSVDFSCRSLPETSTMDSLLTTPPPVLAQNQPLSLLKQDDVLVSITSSGSTTSGYLSSQGMSPQELVNADSGSMKINLCEVRPKDDDIAPYRRAVATSLPLSWRDKEESRLWSVLEAPISDKPRSDQVSKGKGDVVQGKVKNIRQKFENIASKSAPTPYRRAISDTTLVAKTRVPPALETVEQSVEIRRDVKSVASVNNIDSLEITGIQQDESATGFSRTVDDSTRKRLSLDELPVTKEEVTSVNNIPTRKIAEIQQEESVTAFNRTVAESMRKHLSLDELPIANEDVEKALHHDCGKRKIQRKSSIEKYDCTRRFHLNQFRGWASDSNLDQSHLDVPFQEDGNTLKSPLSVCKSANNLSHWDKTIGCRTEEDNIDV